MRFAALLMMVAGVSVASCSTKSRPAVPAPAPAPAQQTVTENEAAAIRVLKITLSAQVAYRASCGNGGFAATFVVLGTPPAGGQPFVPADLGHQVAPVKSGYGFTMGAGAGARMGPTDCNGTSTITAFYISARPMKFGETGGRSFAANAGNTIWQSLLAAAPSEPFNAPATPIR